MSLILGSPEVDKALLMCHTFQRRQEGSFFWAATNAFLIQPRKPLVPSASRAHWCSCWAWCSPVPPEPFLRSCFPASQYWYTQLFLPRDRTSQDSCQSILSAFCLIQTSSVCQEGRYESLCQKPYSSQDQHLHCSSFSHQASPLTRPIMHNFTFINPCWLLLITFLFFKCLETVSRIICSITCLGTDRRPICNSPDLPPCTSWKEWWQLQGSPSIAVTFQR